MIDQSRFISLKIIIIELSAVINTVLKIGLR